MASVKTFNVTLPEKVEPGAEVKLILQGQNIIAATTPCTVYTDDKFLTPGSNVIIMPTNKTPKEHLTIHIVI
jgi:hypothetical protein